MYKRQGLQGVKRIPFTRARAAATAYDFMGTYVDDLPNVLDIAAIRDAGVRIGADPLGGAAVDYWGEIAQRHGLNLSVVTVSYTHLRAHETVLELVCRLLLEKNK